MNTEDTRFVKVNRNLCIGCGLCVDSCYCGAISLVWDHAEIDHNRCNFCGLCLDACPQRAIVETIPVTNSDIRETVAGLRQRTDELLQRIERLRS